MGGQRMSQLLGIAGERGKGTGTSRHTKKREEVHPPLFFKTVK